MTSDMSESELKERVQLIESMIFEGRRTTESWGWSFLFWGVAYYVAIGWTAWTHYGLAWLITMVSASLLMWAIVKSKTKKPEVKKPDTTVGRAIFSIWIAMGISMSVLLTAMGFSGRFNAQMFVAVVGAMLGTSNAASGMILRWKAQFACALVWWAAAAAACFATVDQSTVVFLVAIFFCQIVFGAYAMSCEARARRQGALHA
jgi:hypothetical protein